jgi:hypothetical protein
MYEYTIVLVRAFQRRQKLTLKINLSTILPEPRREIAYLMGLPLATATPRHS